MSLKTIRALAGWATTLLLTIVMSGCNFRTPAPVTPLTNNRGEKIPKSFFYRANAFSAQAQSDQTFLASWAPINEKGQIAEAYLLAGVPQAYHLNIRWEISEKYLFGYQVNPSFSDRPQDQRNQAIIQIPIKKHYHYEAEKDDYQRDTNRYVKNDDRDAWNYRPYMDLDLDNMEVNSWSFRIFWKAPTIIKVSEVEWDWENQYLAFTVDAKDNTPGQLLNSAQASFRFNFLATKGTPGFKPMPFDNQMAKYINVLHVIGKVAGGDTAITYAGHWDVTKPIDMYTHGVPNDEVMQIVADSVEAWNETFAKLGIGPKDGRKAINLIKTPLKYPFDLRYPVINWIDDRRESYGSPLGIGLAIGDVHTGEFKYSSVSIWGGLMREIVNRSLSTSTAYGGSASNFQKFDISAMFDTAEMSAKFRLPEPLSPGQDLASYMKSEPAMNRVLTAMTNSADRWTNELATKGITPGNADTVDADGKPLVNAELAAAWKAQADRLKEDGRDEAASIYMSNIGDDVYPSGHDARLEFSPYDVFHEVFSDQLFIKSRGADQGAQDLLSRMSYEQYEDLAMANAQHKAKEIWLSDLMDRERTFDAIADQIDPADLDPRKAYRSLAKAVLIHEIGHILGLGHNFKGNILPEKGTVADVHYDQLVGDLKEHGHVATTIMDYYNGRTEVRMDYDAIKPGIYDEQMLRYLYKREYPVITTSNGVTTERYEQIPDDGLPLDVQQLKEADGSVNEYRVGFLPACNDFTASTNMDPLCFRWDRGPTATDIMKNRFADLNAGLMSMINAFSQAKGGASWAREGRLWGTVLSEFSQIRIFYDYMRYLIDENPGYKNAFNKISNNEVALLNFSNACIDPSTAPTTEMKREFARLALKDADTDEKADALVKQIQSGGIQSLPYEAFTRVHDLCQANQYALLQFNEIMKRKGHDHTVFDRTRKYIQLGVTGGEVPFDPSFVFGAFKEIGSLPLRYMTLFTVTNPRPVALTWWGLAPVPIWSMDQSRYSYSSLYPYEFSSLIKTSVEENLNFGGKTGERTEIGTSLLFMNYFLWRNFAASKDDFNRFPKTYIDNLRSLTSFDISFSPIILTNLPKANGPVDEVFRYKAAYVDSARRDTIDLPFAYMLPEREVITKGNQQQIFMQISKFRYLTDTWGYYWALELRYHYKQGHDPLKGNSVKFGIEELNQDQIDSCVDDSGRGLSHFFNENQDKFVGFRVGAGIASKQSQQDAFDLSVRKAFETYQNTQFLDRYPDPNACNEAVKGIGLTVLGGALINGYWLRDTYQYMNY